MNRVTLVGLGMGNADTLTLGAMKALQQAKLLIGAPRILESLPDDYDGQKIPAVAATDIAAILRENSHLSPAAVVLSGDTGFYSGAKKLPDLLPDFQVETLPGITTVQYLAAKLQRPWQDLTLASAHGIDCNVLGAVLRGRETFFLTGGTITPRTIAQTLTQAGLGHILMYVGQRLSYADERIDALTASQAAQQDFPALSAVWVEAVPRPYTAATGGIADDCFLRGQVPMTKQEVRAAILAKLQVNPGEILYDVGAGTGSVAVELSLCDPTVQVYAVECNPEACDLILNNRAKFGAYNLTLAEGAAPEAMEPLPAPAAAFIGGSKGNLRAILQCLLAKNPQVRVTISAIAAETMAEALTVLKELPFAQLDITQISVARGRKAGSYHLMTGQNPIFLLSAQGVAP